VLDGCAPRPGREAGMRIAGQLDRSVSELAHPRPFFAKSDKLYLPFVAAWQRLLDRRGASRCRAVFLFPEITRPAAVWIAVPHPNDPYDLIGIGFGPSNLSIAVVLDEERNRSGEAPIQALFLERKREFDWHSGTIFDGAKLQVSCLKDVATLRNPCSRFTFLSYLLAKNRLDEFVNLEDLRPSRFEFQDYLRWVASAMRDQVRYGQEVVAIEAAAAKAGRIDAVKITARDIRSGETSVYLARNLILATGLVPSVPNGADVAASRSIVHSHEFLPVFPQRFAAHDRRYRFVVVGDGQSAAELFGYLIAHYPQSEITAAIPTIAYRPADDSSFVNETFFPSKIDFFYGLPDEKRSAVLADLHNTNYSVVNPDLIEHLYRSLYEAKVRGRTSVRVLPFLQLESAVETPQGVRIELRHKLEDKKIEMEADALVLGTGYRVPNPHPLLDGLASHLQRDESGRHRVARDYLVAGTAGFEPGVFLQGCCQETHGFSDPLLSNAAVRAGRIVAVLKERLAGEAAHIRAT
jgi:L-ornithine N5-oxygenase